MLLTMFSGQFLRALWFALRERVSSLDELDMCTTRLRLLLPGEQLADDKHVIHPLQVSSLRIYPDLQTTTDFTRNVFYNNLLYLVI